MGEPFISKTNPMRSELQEIKGPITDGGIKPAIDIGSAVVIIEDVLEKNGEVVLR